MNKNIREFKIKDWKKIVKIYKQSFPKYERFSFLLLYFNILMKNSNMFVLEINHEICGFIHFIHYKNMTFILYLAIDHDYRNNGYGSFLLKWCLNVYKNHTIFLNIDEVNIKFDDYILRKQRLEFYLHNGFYLTEYLSVERCGSFNILSTNKILNNKMYIELDQKISKYYFDKESNIQKINL